MRRSAPPHAASRRDDAAARGAGIRRAVLVLSALACVSCTKGEPARTTPTAAPAAKRGIDANVTTRGGIEVTAKLVEIPEGAIFKRDLYDYATVL